jgi:hypothetical protein
MLQNSIDYVVEILYTRFGAVYIGGMPIKKTILGFFVAIACSGAAFAAELPQFRGEEPTPQPSMFERYTESVRSLVDRSLNLLGVPYRLGGTSPLTGFDCSGFVGKVFADALGFGMPRTASEMSQMGEKVSIAELKPGDLVFFNTMRRAFSHVGIYLGDNQFVHAPSTGGVVRVEDMRLSYWAARYDGARRVLPGTQFPSSSFPGNAFQGGSFPNAPFPGAQPRPPQTN